MTYTHTSEPTDAPPPDAVAEALERVIQARRERAKEKEAA